MKFSIQKLVLWLFIIMIGSFSISAGLFYVSGFSLSDLKNTDIHIESGGKFKQNINVEQIINEKSIKNDSI